MICMYKIAVLGGLDTVLGFKALGLDAYPVTDVTEAKKKLRELTAPGADYAIIYVEETLAAEMMPEIDKFKDDPTPAIILIPGREGSLGLGQAALKDAIERAVGADFF